MVGGAEEVERQLQEATSRSPVRFMRLLTEHWHDIPDRFTDDILDGASTYLSHRFGNLQFDANQWIPIEEPDPEVLASMIFDEIERHPVRWHHCRSAAKALKACANVVRNEQDARDCSSLALDF